MLLQREGIAVRVDVPPSLRKLANCPIGQAWPFTDSSENPAVLAPVLEDHWFGTLFDDKFFKTDRPADDCR